MNAEVLLIQAEPELIETLSRSLREHGFSVVTVTTRQEALALIQRREFDVVVLDLIMAGVDCIALMRDVKNLMPLTEVIFICDEDGVTAAAKGIRLGAFDYALKSEAVTELPEKIMQARVRKARQEDKIKMVEGECGEGCSA